MKNKTALITGVAGFIGAELAKSLLKKNYTVVGIDNFLLGREENVNQIKNMNGDFFFINYDLSKYEKLENLNQKLKKYSDIDCIWHLAANSDIRGYENGLKVDFNNTFMTTINIGMIMESLGIDEIVFSSSSAIKYPYFIEIL